jgi:tyrosine-protein phosphatase YwqE
MQASPDRHQIGAEGAEHRSGPRSLTGQYGDAVRALALRLLRSTAVAVIASDAHGLHRPPSLRLALPAVAAVGEANPARFAGTKPRALLNRGLAVPTALRAA